MAEGSGRKSSPAEPTRSERRGSLPSHGAEDDHADPWRPNAPPASLDEGLTPLAPDDDLAALEQQGSAAGRWWRRRPWPSIFVWTKRVALAGLGVLMLIPVVVALVIRHYEAGLPSIGDLRNYSPPQVT